VAAGAAEGAAAGPGNVGGFNKVFLSAVATFAGFNAATFTVGINVCLFSTLFFISRSLFPSFFHLRRLVINCLCIVVKLFNVRLGFSICSCLETTASSAFDCTGHV
jgi:hypothetical protein